MSEESPQASDAAKGTNWWLVAITAALVILSAAEYAAIYFWPGVSAQAKVTAILAIIGAYGVGLGFFSRSTAMGSLAKVMVEELTSPNAALCWASNFTYLGTALNTLAVAMPSRRSRPQPVILWILGSVILIALAFGLIAYTFFHALVVVPIAYPAILAAASVVNAFDTAPGDSILTVTSDKHPEPIELSLKSVVLNDKVTATAFIMGLPSAVLALIGNVITPFL
jgi:hypothetical protein